MLVAARLGSTRLLDNIAIDIGATAATDGHPRVGSAESHELPWRN
jgi:pantoate--beta-alanine ligase